MNEKWNLIPGCAHDIGVGENGTIWIIGCVKETEGYRIHKLNGK